MLKQNTKLTTQYYKQKTQYHTTKKLLNKRRTKKHKTKTRNTKQHNIKHKKKHTQT